MPKLPKTITQTIETHIEKEEVTINKVSKVHEIIIHDDKKYLLEAMILVREFKEWVDE